MFFCQALDTSREEVRLSKQRLRSKWIAVGSIQAECLQAVETLVVFVGCLFGFLCVLLVFEAEAGEGVLTF